MMRGFCFSSGQSAGNEQRINPLSHAAQNVGVRAVADHQNVTVGDVLTQFLQPAVVALAYGVLFALIGVGTLGYVKEQAK